MSALVEPEASINLFVPNDIITDLENENMIEDLNTRLNQYVRSPVGEYYSIITKETARVIIDNARKLIDITKR